MTSSNFCDERKSAISKGLCPYIVVTIAEYVRDDAPYAILTLFCPRSL